ncbi:MAG TPA: hypothetical protein VGF46_05020 [Gaiellales bacterium]
MPFHITIRRTAIRALVLLAVLVVPSAAFADCAHDIIDQAYKGKITKHYSQACYNAAIKIEPVDGSSYSDIDSIIKAAKHVDALSARDSQAVSTPSGSSNAARSLNANSQTAPAVTSTPTTAPSTISVGGGRVPPASSSKPTQTTTPAAPEATSLGAPSATPVLDRLAPAHAGDVPVAVIVLGVLAVLLVLAGVAGAIVRRRSSRSNS